MNWGAVHGRRRRLRASCAGEMIRGCGVLGRVNARQVVGRCRGVEHRPRSNLGDGSGSLETRCQSTAGWNWLDNHPVMRDAKQWRWFRVLTLTPGTLGNNRLPQYNTGCGSTENDDDIFCHRKGELCDLCFSYACSSSVAVRMFRCLPKVSFPHGISKMAQVVGKVTRNANSSPKTDV